MKTEGVGDVADVSSTYIFFIPFTNSPTSPAPSLCHHSATPRRHNYRDTLSVEAASARECSAEEGKFDDDAG